MGFDGLQITNGLKDELFRELAELSLPMSWRGKTHSLHGFQILLRFDPLVFGLFE
jgi:hypothetical protein